MNTKRKYVNKGFSILNSQVNFSVLLIILIGFTLLNIPYIINSDLFISMVNTDYLILNINHNDTIKGTLEAKNIKIENVDIAVEKVRDGAIYIGAGKSNGNTDNFLISALDLDQLHLDFYLHLVILYLLVILFVIMIMKSISKRNLKFEFVQKLPFGPYLQTLLLKLFN
jgi:hypothetical protein